MLNLFRKHPQVPSYGTLALDLHSHLLPGIDDGAKDVGHSLALIRRLQGMGFTRLFTTPHIMADMYPNTPEIIGEKLAEVRAAMKDVGLNIPIDAAAEYLMDEAFGEKIKAGSLLTLPGNRVLVEMSFVSAPPNLGQHIFQLQTKGYKVLLAHPERYLFFRDNFKKYKELKDRGVEFQLNLLSLVGYYGKPTQDNAKALLKAGMIDYLGSDLHHERHADNLERLLADRKLNRLLGKYLAGMKNAVI
ncbi:MAG: tyrosine-protein phosphatase [Lewinella sp.]|uniref:tyrosine-protein phosphatase n=1 Tax=Lewinella sp. TaxID=2004506 RepID=UPI003D6B58E7